ncbi:SAVED domain-containing protein [Escherichia coli]|uniref:SAVED domain-containing protein n=1 Tax=Escherichia coli TaxID=562 RepID=UPI00028DF92C|nr:SAVED domain-containing protein [Escherichia coli]MED6440342.1 SAVED domain-containing protein [Escherichia coli O157]EEQ1736280.1 SAVED domain-containing protein [Escherichia coli]EEQ1745909.1 SAVED domain-containing protein [Escherichia coli]EEU9307218.1 SAVED domain-containing protein [Escherichia coli]EEU9311870.1 SAVED domain-containing protein [Escherichia coli]
MIMNKTIILYILKLIFRPKDILTRIGFGLFSGGVAASAGGWGMNLVFSEQVLKKYVNIFDGISISYQRCSEAVLYIGIFASILGLLVLMYCIFLAVRDVQKRDIAFIRANGFENIDPHAAEKMLSSREKVKTLPVDLKAFDSRDKSKVIEESTFIRRMIKDRIHHSEATVAYVAALGSIPYLYMIGSSMRDGHLPLRLSDFDRNKNCFHLLDAPPTGSKLIRKFGGEITENSSIVSSNVNNQIGLAISFTMNIQPSDLPVDLSDHTLHIQLDTGFRFDNLPSEEEQENITKEVSFIISELNKKADEVHLFISAQASFVVRLGSLYQEGLHGVIYVWHWNSIKNEYEWSLKISGKELS